MTDSHRDPGQLVQDIWAWLPVFRVVAETQHLPTAAKRLHVSASALSRTIRLIEEQLGQELFIRGSRRIMINSAGAQLLESLRGSMSTLEQGLRGALSDQLSGSLRVSSLGVLTDYVVLPASLELSERHPTLVPTLTTLLASQANQQLATGLIDVAFYYDATSLEGIQSQRLGILSNGVYCGLGHPLFDSPRVTRKSLLEHPFSVASIGDRGTPMDGWPVELERVVGFRIYMLSTNIHVALSGSFVCVLPDIVAMPLVEEGKLRCLDAQLIPETEVFAAIRDEDRGRRDLSQIVEAVTERIQAAPHGKVTRVRRVSR